MQVLSDGPLNLASQRRKKAQLDLHLDIAISQVNVGKRTFVLGAQMVAFPGVLDLVPSIQVPSNAIHTITSFAVFQTMAMFYMNTGHSRIYTLQNRQPYSLQSNDIPDLIQTIK